VDAVTWPSTLLFLPLLAITTMRVIITGASGVLGSAVHAAFRAQPGTELLALSHTRTGAGLEPLDLLDAAQTEARFGAFRPDWVIHCAAERRPDVAAKVCVCSGGDDVDARWGKLQDPEGTVKVRRPDRLCRSGRWDSPQLNAELPGQLAQLSKKLGFTLVYISTGL
jgi:S-adenosylmethionine synthetase